MGIETITFKNQTVPKFQSEGFAAKFAFPLAQEICKGNGLDVGCMKPEWAFPGARPIDIAFNEKDTYGNLIEAANLPEGLYDYIFSSNMLEHYVGNWCLVLDHWWNKLKCGGNIFLYLPSYKSVYWRPWNNFKHIHIFTPEILKDYFEDRGWENINISNYDLNYCFSVVASKPFDSFSNGIYKILNLVNGKSYIGATTMSFSERFKSHIVELKAGRHYNKQLQEDFDLHGICNFKFLKIKDCRDLSVQEVVDLESRLISETENVYNIQKMGKIVKKFEFKIDVFEKNGNFVGSFCNLDEVARKLQASRYCIQNALRNYSFEKYYLIKNKWSICPFGKAPILGDNCTIHEIDQSGNVVNVFWKAEDAAISLGCSRTKVANLLKKQNATIRGTKLILPFSKPGKKRNFKNGYKNKGVPRSEECKAKILKTKKERENG